MKRNLILFSLLLFITVGFAQSKPKKADRLYAEFAYVDAAKEYEKYLEKEKEPGIGTIANVANAYYYTGNTADALRWYAKLDGVTAGAMDDVTFNRYVQSLRAEGKAAKADELLKKRLEAKGDQAAINTLISQKKYLDSLNKAPSNFKVSNLAANSDKSDFGAAFYGNQIVYSSSKDTNLGNKVYAWNDQPFLELYVADRNAADGSFFNDKKFIPDQQSQYHNATLTFSSDLKTIYYSANVVKKNDKLINDKAGTNNFEIIKGTVNGDKLTDVEKLPFNSKDYSVGHPSLSADGKRLYFASDMPGGYGDTDIYVAEVFANGKVGEPKNLGPKINTSGREMFPFVNDSILYFSSDGHYGMGGLDVFESRWVNDSDYSEPKNLGAQVNSVKDDFSFIIDKGNKYGYFSSNRAGGKGDDDIYYFTRQEPPCEQWVSGKVTNQKYKMAINQADIKVYDQYGDVIATAKTGEDGSYKVKVPCGSKIKVEASKENHTKADKELATSKKNGEETKDVNFELSNYADLVRKEDNVEKVDINPIYFDYDKYAITEQASMELDKVVYVMKNFPSIVIKIESHTDSRGKDQYNLVLSQNRAKATYDYIITRGIDPSRIESVKGYGETRLRNKCSNGVKCTEEQHSYNRRSDFIIVKK
ncbi:OmpA family protein [Flavobacterium sp. AG291]|uniref:OmpA family protein n=1 Tax=Flavobacterium sp. AG291 TaxID=2184000 RepID=UPI000E0C7214|nr:OmpA family protein [Flavobacterium sp. AG291]RDI09728.1 outer membrane protein OmpA-like peptidoglycan-associated protein [Flavobacterium sp. AG291]